VQVDDAARRWADVWQRAWPQRDGESIVALYADQATYRALAFRAPDLGRSGVRGYLARNFAVESDVECRFDAPIVGGDRATVQWWASWVEAGHPVTLAGVTVLTFDAQGLVVDHRDYWNQLDERRVPYPGW
jgi:hypothetical protein